jgi:hypothetical protein
VRLQRSPDHLRLTRRKPCVSTLPASTLARWVPTFAGKWREARRVELEALRLIAENDCSPPGHLGAGKSGLFGAAKGSVAAAKRRFGPVETHRKTPVFDTEN